MRDETNAADLPDMRPSAREMPMWPVGERRETRVSWTTERGDRPMPKMKRPVVWLIEISEVPLVDSRCGLP